MKKHEKEEKKQKWKILKYILIIIFSLAILAGITYISITFYMDYKQKSNYEELSGYMEDNEVIEETAEKVEDIKTEKMIKLEELNTENEDIVAWLEIDGTDISYPILQAEDNSYYLNHDYQKNYAATGSIFLDKDVDLSLPSTNFLMYGHRNKNGLMFEKLLNYKDESFYKEHKKIRFTTLNEDAEYEITSVFYSRVYYKDETNVFRYYYFINAETEEEYNEYVDNCKKASIYDTGVTANYGEQLITLSTCEYSQENGRFVVVAKKIEN